MSAALAQRLRRLGVHGNGDIGVDDARAVLEAGMGLKNRRDHRFVANQDENKLGMTLLGDRKTGDNGLNAGIAAHRVNRNRYLIIFARHESSRKTWRHR
jgi:hypothetical protein